jgi:CheY-like chemotaxis protein
MSIVPQTDRVLLAEDNPVNREVAIDILEIIGCKADVVNNGAEVLQAVETNAYRLILMDCKMPVMDGYTATRLLREREKLLQLPRTPVIALTAHAIAGSREECLECGMDDFLCKPFGISDIEAMITKWGVMVSNASDDLKCEPEPGKQDAVNAPCTQSTSAETVTAILDPRALERLRTRQKQRNKPILNKVIGLYLEQTPKLLAELDSAFEQGDDARICDIAHTLKSSSIAIGAARLAEICVEIEMSVKSARLSRQTACELHTVYRDLEKILRKILSDEE